MSKELDIFNELLTNKVKKGNKPQVIWGVVSAVNWQEKTMTVKSVVDDLEYYDVLLGLGSFYRKPVTGVKCIIAKIENSNNTVLIDAEQFEEAIYQTDNSQFVIKQSGFEIKQGEDSLKSVLNDLNTEVGKLCDALSAVVVNVDSGVTPNIGAINQIKAQVTTAINNRLNNILTA